MKKHKKWCENRYGNGENSVKQRSHRKLEGNPKSTRNSTQVTNGVKNADKKKHTEINTKVHNQIRMPKM